MGKMSVAAPAEAAQKMAKASDGLGPERSSHRPAAMAPNAGNKATLASIAPTSKELALCSSASSVTQKRMPVVQECKISNMNRTRTSFPYITPSPYGFSRHNTDIKASLTDATPEFEREQKAFAANKKPKAHHRRYAHPMHLRHETMSNAATAAVTDNQNECVKPIEAAVRFVVFSSLLSQPSPLAQETTA